jgi:hypothetical protein
MTRNVLIGLALALVTAGCATTGIDSAADQPSAALSEAMRPLAGHWQGTLWETASVYYQGSAAVDVQITEDGRWTGSIGRAFASGTARMRHGWLVLSGTETAADGHHEPVFYELKGNASERWGEVASDYSGRDGQGRVEHAEMSLQRAS